MTGLIDEWPALRNDGPAPFRRQVRPPPLPREAWLVWHRARRDDGDCVRRMQHSVSVAELVQHTESEHIIVLDEWGKGRSEWLLLQDLLQVLQPRDLRGRVAARVFARRWTSRRPGEHPCRHLILAPIPTPTLGPDPGPKVASGAWLGWGRRGDAPPLPSLCSASLLAMLLAAAALHPSSSPNPTQMMQHGAVAWPVLCEALARRHLSCHARRIGDLNSDADTH